LFKTHTCVPAQFINTHIFSKKVWRINKNNLPLHRYPENNLFTLKRLIPIEDIERLPVKVIALFFLCHIQSPPPFLNRHDK
jgi:hypothetical protein